MQECTKLGIPGTRIRSELQGLGRELPAHMARLMHQLQSATPLADACNYYADFTHYAHTPKPSSSSSHVTKPGSSRKNGASSELPDALSDLLPVLTEVREGRTQPPPTPPPTTSSAAAAAAEPSIDWGALGGLSADAPSSATAAISWDFDLPSGGGEPAPPAAHAGGGGPAISWDLDVDLDLGATGHVGDAKVAEEEAVDVKWDVPEGGSSSEAAPGISWDIDVTDVGAGGTGDGTGGAIDWDIGNVIVEEAGLGSSTAREAAVAEDLSAADAGCSGAVAAAASRLEKDAGYRSLLLDDLQELRAFLMQVRACRGGGGRERGAGEGGGRGGRERGAGGVFPGGSISLLSF